MSIFTFGAMRITFNESKTLRADWSDKEANAVATIKRALELGINHIDTARGYDNSERLVGVAMRELGREKFILTTKAMADLSYDETSKSIEESLRQMGIDRIDILDLHGINTFDTLKNSLGKNGSLRAAIEAQKKGLVSHIGFSSHAGPDVIIAGMETGYFSAISILYWWTNQRNSAAIQKARDMDIGILILSAAEKGGLLFKPTDSLLKACAPFSPLALTHKWLFERGVTTIAIGASNPGEFDAHLPALQNNATLTTEESLALESWTNKEIERLGKDRCAICYKCMPCPEGVNIPEILRLRNLCQTFDMIEFGIMRYNLLEHADDWFPGNKADKCTRCGKCEPLCPSGLGIPDLISQTHSLLLSQPKSRLWK